MKKTILCFFGITLLIAAFLAGFFQPGKAPEQGVAITVEKLLDVPAICQYPELPTGCESAAAAMVLQYYGAPVTAAEFAGHWLPRSENFYRSNGILYGPDPYKVFAGNPFTETSYGCFSAVIAEAVNRNSLDFEAECIIGQTPEQLCRAFLEKGMPVLIWATMGMKESRPGRSWFLEDGTPFIWTAGEHCLVLVGYGRDHYFLNDPISGSTVAYRKELVEKRFSELGSQAVLIRRKEVL